jgi:hypothetical protein
MTFHDSYPLVGTWVTAPYDHQTLEKLGRVTLQFTTRGNLVHSVSNNGQETVRFLRYRVEGDMLISKDGDPPFEERRQIAMPRHGELHIRDESGPSAFVLGDPCRSFDASGALVDLAVFGLNFGFDRLREGGTLQPYLITESLDERAFLAFDHDDVDRTECISRARQAVENARDKIETSVIVFDGTLMIAGSNVDAIFAESCEKDRDHGVVLGQRYRQQALFAELRRKGPIVYCGRAENVLTRA